MIDFVRAVIKNPEGQILMVFNSKAAGGAGDWNFPGGKIDPGETPEAAIIRETREEINLDIIRLSELFIIDVWFPGHYSGAPRRGAYYDASADLSGIVLNEPDKITRTKFFTRDEIEKKDNLSMAVRAYLEHTE